MTNVGEVTAPRTPQPAPRPWVKVVLPAPELTGEHDEVPGLQRSADPLAQLAHLVGVRPRRTTWASVVAQLDVRRADRVGRTKPCRSQNPMVAGQLLAGQHDERLAADGGAVRGLDQGGGHPWPWASGTTPKRRSVSPSGTAWRTQRTDRAAVERGQQPAVRRSSRRDRLLGLGQRVGRRVQGGPGTEGRPDDGQDVGGRLGSDPAYVEGHGPPLARARARSGRRARR